MAYSTPTYNYEQSASRLRQNKGFEDASADYGRFLSQERFRRANQDQDRSFKDRFPKVGSHYNKRGLYNSGMRRQDQRQFAQDYNRDRSRLQFDQAAMNTGFEMDRGQSDARFQMDQLELMERLAQARAAGYDPFAGVR